MLASVGSVTTQYNHKIQTLHLQNDMSIETLSMLGMDSLRDSNL